MWLNIFENQFTYFWFIDVFTSLFFRFCHKIVKNYSNLLIFDTGRLKNIIRWVNNAKSFLGTINYVFKRFVCRLFNTIIILLFITFRNGKNR